MFRKYKAIWVSLIIVAVVLSSLGAGAALAQSPATNGVIYAAYQKVNGMLRIISDPSEVKHSEVLISWNQSGEPGLSVTSVVDRVTGTAGSSVTSVPESSLTALPPGATTRRVTVLNAVLRTGAAETPPILGVFHAFIAPNPVAGAYPVTVWDPATGTVFSSSGADVVHLYIASYFSY